MFFQTLGVPDADKTQLFQAIHKTIVALMITERPHLKRGDIEVKREK